MNSGFLIDFRNSLKVFLPGHACAKNLSMEEHTKAILQLQTEPEEEKTKKPRSRAPKRGIREKNREFRKNVLRSPGSI